MTEPPPSLDVSCRHGTDVWECQVTVGDDPGATRHDVRVEPETQDRLGLSTQDDPASVVEESFRFLLEREPRESILPSFELSAVGRHFPEWQTEIRRRLTRS
jgi:hypothetical protein